MIQYLATFCNMVLYSLLHSFLQSQCTFMIFIYLQPLSNPIELINNSSIISFVALCIMLVYIGTCYWSQRNRSFTPFPNDFFRWSETSCLEMLLFSSSSRFDEEGLEEWTFSRGRVLERVSFFKTTKKYCFDWVCCSVIQLQTLRINGSARLVLYPLQNFAVIDLGWTFLLFIYANFVRFEFSFVSAK